MLLLRVARGSVEGRLLIVGHYVCSAEGSSVVLGTSVGYAEGGSFIVGTMLILLEVAHLL